VTGLPLPHRIVLPALHAQVSRGDRIGALDRHSDRMMSQQGQASLPPVQEVTRETVQDALRDQGLPLDAFGHGCAREFEALARLFRSLYNPRWVHGWLC